ncbi:hypothetical protein BHM03_00025141, partial [Ensete ventricosum]
LWWHLPYRRVTFRWLSRRCCCSGVVVWFVTKPHCPGGRRLPQIDAMDHKAELKPMSKVATVTTSITIGWRHDERLLRRQRHRIPTRGLRAVDVLRILVHRQREAAHGQHSESSNSDHSYQDTEHLHFLVPRVGSSCRLLRRGHGRLILSQKFISLLGRDRKR